MSDEPRYWWIIETQDKLKRTPVGPVKRRGFYGTVEEARSETREKGIARLPYDDYDLIVMNKEVSSLIDLQFFGKILDERQIATLKNTRVVSAILSER